MLKSTHKSASAQAPLQPTLPAPWTEHRAPAGHTYYYNSETKQSTYTRPTEPSPLPPRATVPLGYDPTPLFRGGFPSAQPVDASPFQGNPHHSWRPYERRQRQPQDRPKSKHAIPGCAPWLLVKTKLGRRFVHNPATNESLWKLPRDVVGGVVEYDIQERKRKENVQEVTDGNLAASHFTEPVMGVETLAKETVERSESAEVEKTNSQPSPGSPEPEGEIGDEYEEVEVTESEAEDDEQDEERVAKRRRTDDGGEGGMQEVTFSEEDMARQLADMGESYHLDPEEYGDGVDAEEWPSGVEGMALTEDEAQASFMDLLDDLHVNPYSSWEHIVSEGFIIEDDRYTLLSNMRRRQEVFAVWSSDKIQQRKLEKANTVRQNPKIPFLEFLQKYATPKLFWPEFRRKYKKEQELKDPNLSDKDREKLYRDHIHQVTKMSEMERKKAIESLLTSLPPSPIWNSSTTNERGLPPALLTDVRYISLKPAVRDPLVAVHIATLPPPEGIENVLEGSLAQTKRREQDMALKRRDLQVEADRRRQLKELAHGRDRLMAEEEQLQRAMKVSKGGLREQVQDLPQTSD